MYPLHATLVASMPARMLLAALLAAFLSGQLALAQTTASLFSQVDEMVTALSKITGWPVRRKVPSEMLSQKTFRRYVESSMKGRSTKKEIHVEEITLKMFGLIPQDFNLASETVDLVSEQAAAFYDYHKKRLFVLESTATGADQRLALVHELAHALADQQHPLGKYLTRSSPDDDAATAREAVMEGQASWLSWAYESQYTGGKPEVPERLLDELTKDPDPSSPDFPVFSKAPLYLRESLVFPYNAGMRFQDAVYRKLGRKSFDEIFIRAPRSTQQIMDPDAYFKDTVPAEPDPPSLAAVAGRDAPHFRTLTEGSLGEFDFATLLRQYIGGFKSAEVASHWRGGAYRLYEDKRDKHPVLAYNSEWDSPEAARNYFEMYQQVLKAKWKTTRVTSQSAGELTGSGDSGRFEVRLSGSFVQSIEGMKENGGLK